MHANEAEYSEKESSLAWLIDHLLFHLLSYVSYRLCFTCLVLVPLTHLVNVLLFGWLARGGTWTKALLLNGGKRHQAFSCCGWGLWALSALASLPVWLSGPLSSLPQLKTALPAVPHSHVDVVSGAAAATSFVGELFLVQAMLVYEPPGLRQSKLQALSTSKALPRMVLQSVFGVMGKNTFGIARHASAALVVLMGLMLSITGALLLLSVEHMPDIPSRVLYCCLSLVCIKGLNLSA
ncbi:hypothetical protein DUNSADRAFT_10409 [Dunaliella salina]|uniref:Uncharacterized protein n=1 Tax=Dunaliella salina TaxID=3046 RepID=A0ABQ7GFI6_DUNSA|nr:hypothetical protein DUNSADRAFT_10409 [Dunaliella salina]|eukprot:KAF5833329.1 hypothetical protein DUNSADRAFT_10409 [Dunaliella salina]